MNVLQLPPKLDKPTRQLVADAHVVVLLNCIVPQQKHVFDWLAEQVGKLTILVSTQMEPNRQFDTDWGKLNVVNQSNLMLTRKWKHPGAFCEDNYIHIPWKTTRELKRLKPDVVVSYEMGIRTLLASIHCGRKIPWVLVANMSEHTEVNRGRIRPWIRKVISKRATIATYNGPSCLRYMKSLDFNDRQLFHFPYSADPDKIYRGRREPCHGPLRLLFGGALTERKNIVAFCQELLEWCRNHDDRSIEFDIAGVGPLLELLQKLETPNNLKLNLVGHVKPSQLKELYRSSDIYVYPSFADEWGLGVEEALGSGLPVLASRYVQSAETLVADGKNGWLFEPENRGSMREAMDRALSQSRHQLQEMSQAARKSTENYSPENSAKMLCAAIAKAIITNHDEHQG